jgi:hypothetical protein
MNFDTLIKEITSEPLSKSLPLVLRIAITANNDSLAKWVKLELNGYFNTNPELTEEVVVPEYRTVTGYHSDEFDRKLMITDHDLSFVNKTRVRFGVAELEMYSRENTNFSYQDQDMCELINRHMNVKISKFIFHTGQIAGILSAIQTKLIESLLPLRGQIEQLSSKNNISPTEDIVELKPNFCGIGLNINALARKWKDYTTKKRET